MRRFVDLGETQFARLLLGCEGLPEADAQWLRKHIDRGDWLDGDWRLLREIGHRSGIEVEFTDIRSGDEQ